jgi:HTH-type transcriptional regulator/antitoxin HigA
MEIKAIRNAKAHMAAVKRIDQLLRKNRLAAAEDNELEVLSVLVDAYENEAFPIADTDPISLLEGHMLNSGREQADLAKLIGKTMASLVLHRRRHMSLDVIRTISRNWGIPLELLARDYALERKRA